MDVGWNEARMDEGVTDGHSHNLSLIHICVEDLQELDTLIEQLHEDKSCRVIIITGRGRGFIAGADISKLKTASKEHAMMYSRWAKRLYEKIERGRQTVIAAVNGYALGGGLELAISCDIRVAAESAKLGLTETSLGSRCV